MNESNDGPKKTPSLTPRLVCSKNDCAVNDFAKVLRHVAS